MINFKVIKFIAKAHKKEVPADIKEFMNQERKGQKIGDMDFIHFIRAMKKEARK